MHIKQVDIKNFRAIQELCIKFKQPAGWHVLIGDNGSGKSSVLQAIALAIIGTQDILALRLDLKKFIRGNLPEASMGKRCLVNLSAQCSSSPQKNGSNLIKKSSIDFIYGRDRAEIEHSGEILNGFSISYGAFRAIEGNLREWADFHNINPRAAAHTSLFAKDFPFISSIEWLSNLGKDSFETDADKKLTLRAKDAINIIKGVQEFINNGELLPNPIKLFRNTADNIWLSDGKYGLKLEHMSDGVKSTLAMTLDIIWQLVQHYGTEKVFQQIFQENYIIDLPGVIMIDEIDAHLHPTWQTRIGQWFTKYFPNMQFIVTTHSPLICRASEKGTIWQLSNTASKEQIKEVEGLDKKRLVSGNILDAYGTELFGKSPVVLRSEDSHAKLERLGHLNALFAVGQIEEEEEKERRHLQKILVTDDPTGF